MSVFDNLTKKVTETAKAAAKRSSELVEVTKLNLNISTEEEKIEKVYADIGKMVYAAYARVEEIPEAYKVNCEKIKSYEDAIKDMKQKIVELKKLKVCPGCNDELETEIAFCPKCGTRQEMPKPEEAEAVEVAEAMEDIKTESDDEKDQ